MFHPPQTQILSQNKTQLNHQEKDTFLLVQEKFHNKERRHPPKLYLGNRRREEYRDLDKTMDPLQKRSPPHHRASIFECPNNGQ